MLPAVLGACFEPVHAAGQSAGSESRDPGVLFASRGKLDLWGWPRAIFLDSPRRHLISSHAIVLGGLREACGSVVRGGWNFIL